MGLGTLRQEQWLPSEQRCCWINQPVSLLSLTPLQPDTCHPPIPRRPPPCSCHTSSFTGRTWLSGQRCHMAPGDCSRGRIKNQRVHRKEKETRTSYPKQTIIHNTDDDNGGHAWKDGRWIKNWSINTLRSRWIEIDKSLDRWIDS